MLKKLCKKGIKSDTKNAFSEFQLQKKFKRNLGLVLSNGLSRAEKINWISFKLKWKEKHRKYFILNYKEK